MSRRQDLAIKKETGMMTSKVKNMIKDLDERKSNNLNFIETFFTKFIKYKKKRI